jgi:hypothetical protein
VIGSDLSFLIFAYENALLRSDFLRPYLGRIRR